MLLDLLKREVMLKVISSKIDFATVFWYNFEARRGVRVVDGAALEKRSPRLAERGFESHPLRFRNEIIGLTSCYIVQ